MASDKSSRTAEQNSALPYRFGAQDLLTAVETLRVHGPQAGAFGAALRSKASYVKAGMDLLGLIESGTLELTQPGRDLAYGRQDGSTPRAFLRVLLAFEPFRSALTHFVAARSDISDVDAIAAFWGRLRIGVSDTNRAEGALVFAHLCASAGLGKLIVGRSGEKSRLQWESSASALLEAANGSTIAEVLPEAIVPAEPQRRSVHSPPTTPVPVAPPDTESFRLVTRRGAGGRLELPATLDPDDLRALKAQVEAVFALLRARAGAAFDVPDDGNET